MDVSGWYQRFEKLLPAILVGLIGYGLTTLVNIDKNISTMNVQMTTMNTKLGSLSTVLENTNTRLDLIKNDIAAIRVDTMLK